MLVRCWSIGRWSIGLGPFVQECLSSLVLIGDQIPQLDPIIGCVLSAVYASDPHRLDPNVWIHHLDPTAGCSPHCRCVPSAVYTSGSTEAMNSLLNSADSGRVDHASLARWVSGADPDRRAGEAGSEHAPEGWDPSAWDPRAWI